MSGEKKAHTKTAPVYAVKNKTSALGKLGHPSPPKTCRRHKWMVPQWLEEF